MSSLNSFRKANDNHAKRRQFVVTDDLGRARIERIHAGQVAFYSDHANALGMREELEPAIVLASATTKFVLVMPLGYDISGRVVDARGNAVFGATIWYGDAGGGVAFAVARSEPDGRFSIRQLLGSAQLMASADQLGSSGLFEFPDREGLVDGFAETFTQRSHTISNVELVLDGSGCVVEGIVRAPDGEPIAGARVTWLARTMQRGAERIRQPYFVGTSDDHGSFRFAGLRPAFGELAVSARGYALWSDRARIDEERATRFEAVLSAGARVSGSVRASDGTPLAGARVVESKRRGNAPVEFHEVATRTDAEGGFQLDHIAAGSFELSVLDGRAGDEPTLTRKFEARSGEWLTWDARFSAGSSIVGRAVDEQGRPLASWPIVVASATSNISNPQPNAMTDAEGRFEVRDLADVDHIVKLLARGNRSSDDRYVVAERIGVRPGGAELVFIGDTDDLRNAYMHGRVLDSIGRAVPATVRAVRIGEGMNPFQTANDGSFRIGPVQRGDQEVWVEPRGQSRMTLTVKGLAAHEERDLGDIVVPEVGQLLVDLRLENGGEIVHPTLRLKAGGQMISSLVKTDDGSFASGDVYAGRYTLVVNADNAVESRIEVEIQPRESSRIALTLQPGVLRHFELRSSEPELRALGKLRVVARDAESKIVYEWLRQPEQDASASARFAFKLPFGQLSVEATSDDGRRARVQVAVTPSDVSTDVVELFLTTPH